MVALRSLVEVDRRGTMTAAAEALGYTPGAVSQHIASLSKAVGQPVVAQAGRGVRLTEAGLVVLAHARRVLESEDVVERELGRQGGRISGTLTIGSFGSGSVLLAVAVTALRAAYPDLRVGVHELRETSNDNPSLAVAPGDVDVALGRDYPDAPIPRSDDLEYRLLASERFGVAGLASGDAGDVALADLAGLDWVIPPPDSGYGAAVRAACRKAGFEPRARHLVTDTAMSLRMAADGLGITPATPLMLRFAAPHGCPWHGLRDELRRDVVLVLRRADADRPVVEALVDALRDALASDTHRAD